MGLSTYHTGLQVLKFDMENIIMEYILMAMYQLFKLEKMKLEMILYCISIGSRNTEKLGESS
jgi:hypothetical protein